MLPDDQRRIAATRERCAECGRPLLGAAKTEQPDARGVKRWVHSECALRFRARSRRDRLSLAEFERYGIRVYPRSLKPESQRDADAAEGMLVLLREMMNEGALSRDEFMSAMPPEWRRERQPVVCPICEGRGRVPNDFYGPTMNNSALIICQACAGAGVVWKEAR